MTSQILKEREGRGILNSWKRSRGYNKRESSEVLVKGEHLGRLASDHKLRPEFSLESSLTW
jgi:hypothetical protein